MLTALLIVACIAGYLLVGCAVAGLQLRLDTTARADDALISVLFWPLSLAGFLLFLLFAPLIYVVVRVCCFVVQAVAGREIKP